MSDKITAVDERISFAGRDLRRTLRRCPLRTHYLNQHRMQYGQPPKVESAANVFNQLCYHNKNMPP